MDRAGPRGRSAGWTLLLTAVMLVLVAPVAGAQDDGGAPATTEPAPEIAVFGVLAHPVHGPVEGARIEVRSNDREVGADTSDATGAWRIPVPGPGRYAVALEEGSLPDGVELRNPDLATLSGVLVLEGRDKRVNFSLGERIGGSTTARSGVDRALTLAWSGIVVGLVISLSAIGLSLVFGATGLVNFAHGEMVTFGALIAWFFSTGAGGPQLSLFLAGALAMVAAGAFGALQDRALWRPLGRRRLDLVSMMIVSIGLAMMLRYAYAVVFKASPRPFREFAAQAPWTWGPVVFPPKQLVIVVLALTVIVVYASVLQRTRIGTAIRAVSDNRDLAESSGIDVGKVVLQVWIVGSALAALGGVAYATLNGVQWDMGFRLLLPIFAAVVLGGLGTAYGPLVGGLAIGLVSELSTLWFPAEFKFAWALAALIVVLVVRPQGILGRAERVG